jgi:predicted nucleic acid-binding protein
VSRLLGAFESPERPHLVTSELTFAELLVKPYKMKRYDLINAYDNWTISNLYIEVVPVVREVLRDAAYLRARDKSLKLPDAIHLTTAQGTKCRYFLTKDKRIKGQFGVEILFLSEENVDMLLRQLSNG